jgi:hypothetical protein
MAKFAIGLGFFQLWRIVRLNGMRAFFVSLNDLFMGKVFIGKRWLDMAYIGAVDLHCYGVMGQFFNIRVAVSARNTMMDAFTVDMFTNIIIYPLAIFIDPADEPVFMAHETVFFVRGFSPKTGG